MKRKTLFLTVLVQLAIASSLLFTVHRTVATTYTPGVKAGDYVKYGTVSASFTPTTSGTPAPQFVKDFQTTSFFRLDVISVSGTNATEKWTANYNNGTVLMEGINWDVQILNGNVSSLKGVLFPIPLLVAAGLTISDIACTGTGCSSPNLAFNSTTSRTYAGMSRNDNVITIAQASGGSSSSITAYWDQTTGAFMEFSISLSFTATGPGGPPPGTYAFNMAATETNLWSATIFGLSPLVFYGIIGAIVVIVGIVGVAMVMRMRKPKVPTMPTPTGPTTPLPGP